MKKYLKKIISDNFKFVLKRQIKKMKFKSFKHKSVKIDKNDLINGFRDSGIVKGDILFVHSSLKGLGYIENGANSIIDALQEVVGEEGTLVLPAFTIHNSMLETLSDPKEIFDAHTTSSTAGIITETFRKRKNVIRSIHPSHSVAAWGKYAEFITEDHYLADTNFGAGTPFGKFLSLNGKVVGLGINYAPVTFYHVFEDYNLSIFPHVYLDDKIWSKVRVNGKIEDVNIYCHNPEFHKNRIEKDPKIEAFFSDYLEKNKISKKHLIGQGSFWWVYSKDLIDALEELQKKNITIYNVPGKDSTFDK